MTAVAIKIDLSTYKHRFVRILPDQIEESWTLIVPFIEDALISSADGDNISMVYTNLLLGKLEAWILVRKGNESDWSDSELAAVVTVQVTKDNNTDSKSLLIYTVTGAEYLSDELWLDMTVATAEYGRSRGCTNIIAISSNSRVINIFKIAGANVEARYMVMKIGVK